uniref:Uncharacterized protein n=1 Tax=Gloeothece verrucosa (strain PCC 7822) TaxID=497965 RepID=E0UEI1_GLOV7|nr:hypothetical protein Cyan7822_3481 [Gloeothece verrucosa PCC 7822]
MSLCPICAVSMLRHYSQGRLYYFCGRCRQEMPCSLNQKTLKFEKSPNLSDSLESLPINTRSVTIR